MRAVITLEADREIEKRAVQQGTVIVGKRDKTGLLHEPTKLDQMPRAFSSGHDPCPRVTPCPRCIKTVPRLPQPLCRQHQRHQRGARIAGSFPERIVRRAHSTS